MNAFWCVNGEYLEIFLVESLLNPAQRRWEGTTPPRMVKGLIYDSKENSRLAASSIHEPTGEEFLTPAGHESRFLRYHTIPLQLFSTHHHSHDIVL
ncbi:hypothetical protein Pst134EB_001533 [Puccinia striiformis f. sp. tritici]|nr:hypothetical protein Pst134EB_001533 [Puccinia striiformis f. sp. tritici]